VWPQQLNQRAIYHLFKLKYSGGALLEKILKGKKNRKEQYDEGSQGDKLSKMMTL